MKVKEVIGLVFMFGGCIGAIICAIMNTVFRLKNPNMTEYAVLLENPTIVTIGCVCILLVIIGGNLFGVNNKR